MNLLLGTELFQATAHGRSTPASVVAVGAVRSVHQVILLVSCLQQQRFSLLLEGLALRPQSLNGCGGIFSMAESRSGSFGHA